MPDPNTCRCCGALVIGERLKIRRCIVCDRCDRMHGDELNALVVDLVSRGAMDPGHALARMLLDDAHHAGMLIVIQDEHIPQMASLWIEHPVPRWRVYVGRRKLLEQPIDAQIVVDLAMRPYMELAPTPEVIGGMRAEITAALRFVGLIVRNVAITPMADKFGPGHVNVHIEAEQAPEPEQVVTPAPEVAIPDDIMQRARGQA